MHKNRASTFGDSPDSPLGYSVVLLNSGRADIVNAEELVSSNFNFVATVGVKLLNDFNSPGKLKK